MTEKNQKRIKCAFQALHILGVTLFCLGLSVLSGYVAHRERLHTWIEGSTPVALPTALGFVIAGAGLLIADWILGRHQARLNGKVSN